jgi:hypothetical protein
MKERTLAILFLIGFQCVFTQIGQTQQGTYSCPLYSQVYKANASCNWFSPWDSLPLPNPPAGMACCNPFGIPFGESCVAPRAGCSVPPNAANEVCVACNAARTAQGSAAPIDFATGNTFITQSDVAIPGIGGGLQLSRTWNSLLPAMQQTSPFMFGSNWRSNYEERLIFTSGDGYLKYARGDGSVWSFAVASMGSNNVYTGRAHGVFANR